MSVQHDGTTQEVTSTDATVGQLVASLGLDLSPTDRMSAKSGTPLADGMRIVVNRVVKTTTYTMTKVDYDTVRKTDSDLPAGTVKVTQQGKDGMKRTSYAVVYVDGKLVGKTKIATAMVDEPVDKLIVRYIDHRSLWLTTFEKRAPEIRGPVFCDLIVDP